MTVETATKISQLNALFPPGSDPKSEGDNHLRLLKSVLQACFDDSSGTSIKTVLPLDTTSAANRGMLFGLTTANNGGNTNAIDIAAGSAAADDAIPAVMTLASVLTKRLDAVWAVGGGNGGLDGGTVADGSYHLFLIRRPDTGVVDGLFSLSPTAPAMPTSYTQKRRIASVLRSGGIIAPYIQDGDQFMWQVPHVDVNVVNPGAAAVTRTLSVPGGIRVKALMQAGFSGGVAADNPAAIYISDLLMTDTAATAGVAVSFQSFVNAAFSTSGSGHAEAMTNTARQVRSRLQQSSTGTTLFINTKGYVDTRGRMAYP